MRVLLISGSHSRNLALAKKIYVNKKVKIVGYIIFKREEMVPKPRSSLNNNLKKLWKIHFKKRLLSEKKHYDSKNNFIKKIKNKLIIRNISDFNGDKVTKFVKSLKIDSCFIQGCPIIKDPLYSLLPKYTVNLHIGLIPFYKGSITAFWPFYFLQPSMLGTTYHIIRKNVDTGEIIHQNTPKLDYGDNLHDASCKALLSGISDINLVIKEISYRIKKYKDKT